MFAQNTWGNTCSSDRITRDSAPHVSCAGLRLRLVLLRYKSPRLFLLAVPCMLSSPYHVYQNHTWVHALCCVVEIHNELRDLNSFFATLVTGMAELSAHLLSCCEGVRSLYGYMYHDACLPSIAKHTIILSKQQQLGRQDGDVRIYLRFCLWHNVCPS